MPNSLLCELSHQVPQESPQTHDRQQRALEAGYVDGALENNIGSTIRAKPKSRSLAPLSFTRMLAGFKSRCTIPWRWAAASAPAICPASRNAAPSRIPGAHTLRGSADSGGCSQHDEGDAAHAQVLLVADAAVRREQQLEPRILGLAAISDGI